MAPVGAAASSGDSAPASGEATCYVLSCLRQESARSTTAAALLLPSGLRRVGVVVRAPANKTALTPADAGDASKVHGGVPVVAFRWDDDSAPKSVFVYQRRNGSNVEWAEVECPPSFKPTAPLPLVFLRCQTTYTLPILCPPRCTRDALATCIRAEAAHAIKMSQQNDSVMLSQNGAMLSGKETTIGSLLDVPRQNSVAWASTSSNGSNSSAASIESAHQKDLRAG